VRFGVAKPSTPGAALRAIKAVFVRTAARTDEGNMAAATAAPRHPYL
jgi:hypothetical protein